MSLSHAQLIYRAAIAAVSPLSLVARTVNFDPQSCILNVRDRSYTLNKNVRVVGFGKAVLGMAAAVEQLLGSHISTGLVSVPKGISETAKTVFPHYLLQDGSKTRICEGGAHNQPDEDAHSAAREILSLAREASEEDIVMVLVSGGGSALLPHPVEGVSLQEKAQAIKQLSNAGATINELNSFRKLISQTKGGKLAEAAFPAKVITLVLSDVIGDPLDIIASGPTVPNTVTKLEVLQLLEKYELKHKIPFSILSHLQTGEETKPHPQYPVEDGCYLHTQNVIIGNNRTATQAALTAAESMGYRCLVWSHCIQGEARDIGSLYAKLTHSLLTKQGNYANILQEEAVKTLLSSTSQVMQDDLIALLEQLSQENSRPLCLISAGEPTVTVKERASGVGGRSQELALAFAMELEKLQSSSSSTAPDTSTATISRQQSECVFASVGTDGQDGPGCDAAGALVDMDLPRLANEVQLSPERFLENNDSHTFFSRLCSGRYLIQTGLTGTNVMDIHIMLVT